MAGSTSPPTIGTVEGAPSRDPQQGRPRTSRLAALTGLAGAVVYVVGVLLPGTVPKPDATGSSIASFFVDKRGALLTGFALQLIAVGLLLWFMGQLYQMLLASDPEHPALATTMLAAFAATISIVAAGIVPSMAIIWSGAPGPGPQLARFAYAIMTISNYAATSTVVAVSILAASVIIWRTRVLPRWLCILGAAEIALNAVELIGLSFDTACSPAATLRVSDPFSTSSGSRPRASAWLHEHAPNLPRAEQPQEISSPRSPRSLSWSTTAAARRLVSHSAAKRRRVIRHHVGSSGVLPPSSMG